MNLLHRLGTELHWIQEHAHSVKHHQETNNLVAYQREMKNLLEAIADAKSFWASLKA